MLIDVDCMSCFLRNATGTYSAMNSITMKQLHSIPLGELPQQTAIFPGEITINKNIFYTINLLSLASVK
jgi:hypothetical protein